MKDGTSDSTVKETSKNAVEKICAHIATLKTNTKGVMFEEVPGAHKNTNFNWDDKENFPSLQPYTEFLEK